jgi:hypothetical protein
MGVHNDRKDDYAFFISPVDPTRVPGYADVIKHPMDFGTMSTKVAKGKYRSLEEFTVSTLSALFRSFRCLHTLHAMWKLCFGRRDQSNIADRLYTWIVSLLRDVLRDDS